MFLFAGESLRIPFFARSTMLTSRLGQEVRAFIFQDLFSLHILISTQSTAHTMAFVFGLLALYPDEQEIVYQQVKEICGDEDPVSILALIVNQSRLH